ncbi:unnamed protein product [Effrenium voratum]|nr:unnamed protein product [Effrenium voratum]
MALVFWALLAHAAAFRPPCVPLDVATPYQSTWSCHDNLTDGSPAHWTGDEFDWVGLVRVDGQVYRWLGRAVLDLPAAQQLSREVHPTTTRYIFQAGAAQMTVAFMTASFNHDTALLEATSPVTTMSFSVTGTDDVEIYFDLSAATATQKDSQEVTWQRNLTEQLQVMRVGTTSQKVCGQTSDRIDWGFRYLAIPLGNPSAMVSAQEARAAFVNGTYSRLQDEQPPRKANDRPLALSVSLRAQARVHLMLDEVVSQRFFGTDLRPLWQGRFTAETLLNDVEEGSLQRMQRAEAFDHFLLDQLQRVGGQRYGEIGALVYRQVMGATSTSFNDKTGEAWPFMKEISSDGDVSTVDVIFPAFPLFLHVAPEFFRQLMIPLMVYANNGTAAYGMNITYNLSWAPHHLGTWPVCDIKSEDQEQMPVEESGNMLIMIAAVARKQGKSSTAWLKSYWPLLKTWADFLITSLPDPGNQLCTDDFEGPNPHNVNLAAKGIVALGAYAQLLEMDGQASEAQKYLAKAEGFAASWEEKAKDGDHFRRQYDLPNTWSQKYNLIWQKLLGLSLFKDSVFQQESAEYEKHREAYGIPLDDRHNYTKADWSMWSAAFGSKETFKATVDSLWTFANSTPDRAPFTDFFDTITGRLKGMRARPVMGGIFIGLLTQSEEVVVV